MTCNNTIEDAFLVYTDNGIVKFTRTKEGMCGFKLSKEHLEAVALQQGISAVTTLAENWGNYSHNQFKRAKKARKLCHVMWVPIVKNFKATLQSNQIWNCPVTEMDLMHWHYKASQ